MLTITSSNKISNLGNIRITGILRISFLVFLLSYFSIISTSFAFNNLPSCSNQDKPESPKHRENCYDIIDLPLCSAMKSNSIPADNPTSNGNCVKECKDMDATAINSQPNIGHNYSCIRFCDNPESGITISQGNNCVYRACHQLYDDKIPEIDSKGYYTNCNLLKCNLLSKDELNNTKFNDTNNKWCDSKDVKCYEFGREKLPYIKLQSQNSVCEIHDCKPNSTKCGKDDTLNISKRCDDPPFTIVEGIKIEIGDNKCKAGDTSQNYTDDYIKYVNAGMPIDLGLCKPVMCQPIVKKDYVCTSNSTNSAEVPDNPNPFCTTKCTDGSCSRIIDCTTFTGVVTNCDKKTLTKEEIELCDLLELCSLKLTTDESYSEINSWFYRPRLSDKFTSDPFGLPDKSKQMHKLCYTQNDMEANLGTSWFMKGSSPRRCLEEKVNDVKTVTGIDWSTLGGRSWGYGGICGTGGNVYSKPDADAGYIDGYVKTNYELSNPQHTVTACLRFKNSGALNACGKRECRIDSIPMFFAQTQWCGDDVCVELSIDESDMDKCSLKKDPTLFEEDGEKRDLGCLKMVDKGWGSAFGVGQMRLRAKQYGRRICTFLDITGTFAYDPQYLNGAETLDDNTTCIDGEKDENGKCNGFDTNSDRGLAHRWRTVKWRTVNMSESTVIPYILNPGYYDLEGRFFYEQQCPLIPLRLGPPRFYNIATPLNSPTLFAPPLYILNAKVKRGGEISVAKSGEQYGETDFFEPEIEIKFGGEVVNTNASKDLTDKKSSQLLSLTTGNTDYDKKNIDNSPSYAILETTVLGIKYAATVFVKKSYDENKKIGTFCLYRVFENGKDVIEIEVGCVKRKDPEIYAVINKSIQKAVITSKEANSYNSARISLQIMANQGLNGKDENCQATPGADDICSTQIELEQKKITKEECSYKIEGYKFCAKREECSQLYMECVKNEIDLYKARLSNKPTGNFESIKLQCNTTILNNCNKKWGITSPQARNIFEQPLPDPKTTNYYGWFNEICITNGFDKKLRRVLSYKVNKGASQGKCVIDLSESEKRNKDNPNFHPQECVLAGGKAPKCICKEVTDETNIEDDQIPRFETPREAGLCIDIPIPKACPAIDWTNNPYTVKSLSDPYHIIDSINKNSYGTNLVDYSHLFRTEKEIFDPTKKSETYDASKTKTHAEFDLAIEAETVEGTCNAFWKPFANSSGLLRNPKMKCLNTGEWDYKNLENECIRYECPAISSAGIQSSGNYQNGYGNDETGEQKGTYHGFAYWPKYKKTNDFVEKVNAFTNGNKETGCIIGFKRHGASSWNDVSVPEPYRNCNQLGSWGPPANICERIYCPAINMMGDGITPISTNLDTPQERKNWIDSGGASFPKAPASRSKDSIRPESISTGICNENIGVFKSPGGKSPTKECNYQGIWGEVQNRCVSNCAAIDEIDGKTENNGFAIWPQTNIEVGTDFKKITTEKCVSGYVINPDKGPPTRDCLQFLAENGAKVNIWKAAKNPCIDGCQGYDEDPTEGIGLTTHGSIQIKWTKTDLGKDTIYQSPDSGCTILDASKFQPGRNNGCYKLRRHCNLDGKWDAPIAMCMANNGKIGFANYPDNKELLAIDTDPNNKVIGECIDGYRPTDGAKPIRKCSGLEIDKVALELSEGTKDCEEITCSATASTTVNGKDVPSFKSPDENSGYIGTAKKVKIGEKLYLTCSNSTMMGPNPYAQCNKDGKFDFFNVDSCKKNCSSPTPLIPSMNVRVDADGPGNGDRFTSSIIGSMQHGQVISFSALSDYGDYISGDCQVWDFSVKCIDGIPDIKQEQNVDLYEGKPACGYRIYDWNTKNWGPTLKAEHDTQVMIHTDSGSNIFLDYKTATGQYKDKDGVTRDFFVIQIDD